MGNQQPSTYGDVVLDRALINAVLGDGHLWKHPECKNRKIIWTSIHRDWLEWKMENLLPKELRGSINLLRRASAKNCYNNAKPLYQATSRVHPKITEAAQWSKRDAVLRMDRLDFGIWYLDDGCCIRRNDSGSYRVTISVGALTPEDLFPSATGVFGTGQLGRIYKNNSRATERNMSWIIPKPVAVQILHSARTVAPESLAYKAPLW